MTSTPANTVPTLSRPCGAGAGRCENLATIDLGRHANVPGIPGKVRFLCCHHARGLRGHRDCPCRKAA